MQDTGKAKLEVRLERFPWATLTSGAASTEEISLEFEDGTRWRVASPRGRLPGPTDAQLYVAVAYLFNERGKEQTGEVTFSFRELCGIMGKEPSGNVYKAFKDSLRRLKGVEITAVNLYPGVKDETIFNILKTVRFFDRKISDQLSAIDCTVTFHELILEAIKEKYRLLDVQTFFSLERAVSQRLYRYLDYRRHRPTAQPTFEIAMKQLAKELPVARPEPKEMRRVLDPAHEELIEMGFLRSVEWLERPVKGKKRPEWVVRYSFPEAPRKAVPAGTQAIDTDPDWMREQVEQLVQWFGPRDAAFFAKVIKTVGAVSDQQAARIVGQAKEYHDLWPTGDRAVKAWSKWVSAEFRTLLA